MTRGRAKRTDFNLKKLKPKSHRQIFKRALIRKDGLHQHFLFISRGTAAVLALKYYSSLYINLF